MPSPPTSASGVRYHTRPTTKHTAMHAHARAKKPRRVTLSILDPVRTPPHHAGQHAAVTPIWWSAWPLSTHTEDACPLEHAFSKIENLLRQQPPHRGAPSTTCTTPTRARARTATMSGTATHDLQRHKRTVERMRQQRARQQLHLMEPQPVAHSLGQRVQPPD